MTATTATVAVGIFAHAMPGGIGGRLGIARHVAVAVESVGGAVGGGELADERIIMPRVVIV